MKGNAMGSVCTKDFYQREWNNVKLEKVKETKKG
jgi:hypothetical protein